MFTQFNPELLPSLAKLYDDKRLEGKARVSHHCEEEHFTLS